MLIACSLRQAVHTDLTASGSLAAKCSLAFGSAGLQMVNATAQTKVASRIVPNSAGT